MKNHAQRKPFERVNHRKMPKHRQRNHWILVKIRQPDDIFFSVALMERSARNAIIEAFRIPPELF